jgi:hypothetical protein
MADFEEEFEFEALQAVSESGKEFCFTSCVKILANDKTFM